MKEKIVIYGTARIYIPEGEYTRKDVEDMLEWFNKMDIALANSMKKLEKK
jgi:hypothetical protein